MGPIATQIATPPGMGGTPRQGLPRIYFMTHRLVTELWSASWRRAASRPGSAARCRMRRCRVGERGVTELGDVGISSWRRLAVTDQRQAGPSAAEQSFRDRAE
jgi:hypothetical protein